MNILLGILYLLLSAAAGILAGCGKQRLREWVFRRIRQ
jgi:hypothetical protein